ncbi:allatostatins MIP isoform X1 [Diabrotica virgifera virgifera]|uniref:Allatostatins MIP n=3 Tax=Diabrotica TaxID=50385 RepID=A0ABM5L083_DIAVI|nr:allatostatins MIP isoform X1 [Diabrotica virgifera virgifera]
MRTTPLSLPTSLGKLWLATVLAFLVQATLVIVATSPDETNYKIDDDNLQMENDVQRDDWNDNSNAYNKRAWSSLHGGWGLKRSIPTVLEHNIYSSPPIVQKRNWQNFQSGWGKRTKPDNKVDLQEMATLLEQHDEPLLFDSENDYDLHREDKRKNWAKFSDGWGKRNKWESFKGAWGKREPAWVNLKGLWGKRSEDNSYIN